MTAVPAPTPTVTGPRLLAGWAADGRPDDHPAHLHRHGPLPTPSPRALVQAVEAAGLRGRGGAGFPTATKLRAVRGRVRTVVANGCEGEPASSKDAALLDCAPHLVLDGLALVADALGAAVAVLAVHDATGLQAHLTDRTDRVPVKVVEVPDRYVASQETALVRFLAGGPALPTTTRPTEGGSLVDNVETLAHLALIARYGPAWFRSVGSPDLPGTLLVTADGAVAAPGVVEVPAGTPVRAALDLAGGPTEPVQAVLGGGYGGAWLPASGVDTPLTHEAMRAAGSSLGVPTLLALPTRACGLTETAHLVRYLAGESAGQCGPCRFGLPDVSADLTAIAWATPDARPAYERLRRRLDLVTGRGACALPDGAARLARSALRVFADDLHRHLDGRPCRGAGAAPLFPGVRR
ncbi:NADH-ubiquinone oxidoreductase-F iron-sulfur binding region domain-containing protein [Pseudonocardia xishanensis]|uniref:NADH-ubiquinone oxidoreductase-F iron-sulfur binding region domain-containing protein n=1 Tax=Pseudonocardia xishanensis TaxID=630995 RepID=A0ABP8S2J5_9PSEU